MDSKSACRFVAAVILATMLAACGGGDAPAVCPPNVHPITCTPRPGADGDDATPPVAANDSAASAGLWQGTTSNNRTAYAVLLSSGTYWVIYTVAGDPTLIAGVTEGTATSIGGTFTSTDARDFNLEGLGVSSASVTGRYVPQESLSGTIRYPSQTIQFSATYVRAPAASLAQVAGTYDGVSATMNGSEATTVTVNANGAFTGSTAGGCHFTGTAKPRTEVAVFDVSVTFGGGACVGGTSTVTGIAFYDIATRKLFTAGVDATRSKVFLGLGVKQ